MNDLDRVVFGDVIDVLNGLSGGNSEYNISTSKDIKEFANVYFKFADYDYFDILASLKNPYEMTKSFKKITRINLDLEPNDTMELNYKFIDFVCSRIGKSSDLFIDSTIKAMQYFVEDNIDKLSTYYDVDTQPYSYRGI